LRCVKRPRCAGIEVHLSFLGPEAAARLRRIRPSAVNPPLHSDPSDPAAAPSPAAPFRQEEGPQRLNLAPALQLLAQSGHRLDNAGPEGSAAWLQAVVDALCDLSSRDPLTGLANRRHFELALSREIDRVARVGEPALVLAVDIDRFKQVNDTHGHAAGDQVIRFVGDALLDCVRPMDTVARYGGEEFAVILPNCPPAFGQAVAERIRRKVERGSVRLPTQQDLAVTISIGGAFAPQWVRSSIALWMERADRQLYRAKAEGRNRACLEQPPVSMVTAEEKGLLFGTSQFHDFDSQP
jgi:diguanylate cyclase